jgi:hypothetical protein
VPRDAFTVEPAALQHLGQRLGALAGMLQQARGITQGIDTSGFGAQKLTAAARDFVDRWNWQAEKLGTVLLDTGHRLTQVAQQYQDVEDAQLAMQGQGQAD